MKRQSAAHKPLTKQLYDFLVGSPTPFHATRSLKVLLESSGFKALHEDETWNLTAGQAYYVTRNESSIIAFTYPGREKISKGYKMVGAHTDSPTLKIKPQPEHKNAGVNQLGVEVYGGALLHPWFDRDLSIAGRVSCEDADGEIRDHLIDFRRPIALIPSLAIHLNREANSNNAINAQNHLPVIISLEEEKSFHRTLLDEIGDESLTEVLSFDLVLYDTQPPALVGIDESLLTAAHLDNLLSCFCGAAAIKEGSFDEASLLVCNDHEEVGSRSSHGAGSNFLELVLKRIASDDEKFAQMMHSSILISTDNAHALHPNYQELHEKNHAPLIGGGVVIKYNADQSYATDSRTAALFKRLAKLSEIKTQSYVVRSDQRCGSTIGPITAAKLGVKTIDVGIPTWAMHSIRESAAISDIEDLVSVLKVFYTQSL